MVYRPTALTFNRTPFGSPRPYTAADVPVPGDVFGADRTMLEQQFAYEWLDAAGSAPSRRNPPFTKGAAGRLHPEFLDTGQPQRILRGFIRRAEYDRADIKSTARLYFMYNPETIQRDYVSYLDQGALDPFNTVYQAGNLVAPPSYMDFNFSLLFDRQEEAAANGDFPGVFVDYEYFDLVVRNVLPNYDPNGTSTGGNAIPDNGIMMVNPRDITVVFSPNITVQGRPSNARVSFTKFTHRMIPIRMQIDLTMRVTYFGPMQDMVNYTAEQNLVTDTVPWFEGVDNPFTGITNAKIAENFEFYKEQMSKDMLTEDQITSIVEQVRNGELSLNDLLSGSSAVQDLIDNNIGANGDLNKSLAEWGMKMVNAHPEHKYTDDAGKRHRLWDYGDCSSWCWAVFATHPSNLAQQMGGVWAKATFKEHASTGQIPATGGMLSDIDSRPVTRLFKTGDRSDSKRSQYIGPLCNKLLPGDLLFRRAGVYRDVGHVAIVYANDTSGSRIQIVHSGGGNGKPASAPWKTYTDISTDYTEAYRLNLGNPDSPGNRNGGG
jgi:hypothetical protein